MYGMMAKIPVRRFVGAAVRKVMEGMYQPGGGDVELNDPMDDLPIPQSVVDFGERALDFADRARTRLGGAK